MSANAAPIWSGVPTSKGWFGAVSTKTRLSETTPPTVPAAVLFPEPGRPSTNKICGCRMKACIDVLDDDLVSLTPSGAGQRSTDFLTLDCGGTASRCIWTRGRCGFVGHDQAETSVDRRPRV